MCQKYRILRHRGGEWISFQFLPFIGKGRRKSVAWSQSPAPGSRYPALQRGFLRVCKHTHTHAWAHTSIPLIRHLCCFCQSPPPPPVGGGFVLLVSHRHHMLTMLLKLELRFLNLVKTHWFHQTSIRSARRICRSRSLRPCLFPSNH